LFCFEIEAHWEAANDIVLNYDNFKLTYDTGNITALELDHVEYIKNVHRSIEIIHLKDKSTKTGTVPFGQGDTDFESIFKNIKRLELQDKIFTIQGARQSNTPEKETIKQYIKYVRGIF
jgi:L-ribulose-5-phosphate 3-epimerase UlaE